MRVRLRQRWITPAKNQGFTRMPTETLMRVLIADDDDRALVEIAAQPAFEPIFLDYGMLGMKGSSGPDRRSCRT